MVNSIDEDVGSEAIVKWATGENEDIENFTDQDLIEEASKDDNALSITDSECEVAGESGNQIMHKDAVRAFCQCIQWAEANNMPIQDVLLLRRLKEKAKEVDLEVCGSYCDSEEEIEEYVLPSDDEEVRNVDKSPSAVKMKLQNQIMKVVTGILKTRIVRL
ncbi:hypothetical protein FQR65_LT20292 [Abscondita terminalis]|nr:hypothetical protein FQR65_LT20292 [Abscondita terminalis]